MAQNAAAQREPSMEEILASIRRIIEDSDTARTDVAETAIPQAANASASTSTDVDAYREDLREEAAGSAFAASTPEMAEEARSASITPFVAAAHEAEPSETNEPSEPALDIKPEVEDEPETDTLLTAEDLSSAVPAVEAPKTSIISEAAGRQVAAAFGELSDALMASRRRSFDEIAEEMIRPMLQEWLDNNLPTLVERLVREEIERVARGPAR